MHHTLNTMRIDVYLNEAGLARSRTEAKSMISDGLVYVDGKLIDKPSYPVDGNENLVRVESYEKRYASRGGKKLVAALDMFGIDPSGKLCLDIGASSGGFTDCLLQRGASHVVALDSGKDQLVDYLREDSRVTVLEGFNARYLSSKDLEYIPDLVVMDVSFISATYIIPAVYELLADNSDFICLIKPQFEVGKGALGKGGIVKDKKALEFAKSKVSDFAKEIGFKHIKTIESPIKGGDGNTEYLAHFRKERENEESNFNT